MGWNGFYADGRNSQSPRLPVTVVSSHINLSAIDHSKVAPDFNDNEVIKTESKERLEIDYAIRFTTNGASTPNEINVPLFPKHESLPPLVLITFTPAKV